MTMDALQEAEAHHETAPRKERNDHNWNSLNILRRPTRREETLKQKSFAKNERE